MIRETLFHHLLNLYYNYYCYFHDFFFLSIAYKTIHEWASVPVINIYSELSTGVDAGDKKTRQTSLLCGKLK